MLIGDSFDVIIVLMLFVKHTAFLPLDSKEMLFTVIMAFNAPFIFFYSDLSQCNSSKTPPLRRHLLEPQTAFDALR